MPCLALGISDQPKRDGCERAPGLLRAIRPQRSVAAVFYLGAVAKTARLAVPEPSRARFPRGTAQAEAMDGKEEIRVVEEEPSWQGGSLESLDVIDKVPDESVKLATD